MSSNVVKRPLFLSGCGSGFSASFLGGTWLTSFIMQSERAICEHHYVRNGLFNTNFCKQADAFPSLAANACPFYTVYKDKSAGPAPYPSVSAKDFSSLPDITPFGSLRSRLITINDLLGICSIKILSHIPVTESVIFSSRMIIQFHM